MSSLPTARPRTYIDGIPVIPDDLNDVFDSIIGQKFPSQWQWQVPGRGHLEMNISIGNSTTANYLLGFPPPEYCMVAGADDAVMTFPVSGGVVEGTRITDVGFVMTGNGVGTGPAFASLWRSGISGGASMLGYVEIVDPPGVAAKYTAAIAPFTLAADQALFWYIGMKRATWRIYHVGFKRDRL